MITPFSLYSFKRLLVTATLLAISCAVKAQNFQMQISTDSIAFGDSFAIAYTYDGDTNDELPNFDVLEDNFDILGISPSKNIRSINGRTSFLIRWQIELSPKRKGKLLVPPVSLAGQVTEARYITVSEASKASQEAVFLETIIDKSTAYVQEQVTLTYRIYHSVPIRDLRREALDIDNTKLLALTEQSYQQKKAGKNYDVLEYSYLVLPQKSGVLDIPSLRWEYQYATDPSGWRYKKQNQRSPAKSLRIKTIPASFPNTATWLPARSIQLEETWSQTPDTLQLGEPLTRTLTMTASGLESVQLPPLMENTSTDNFKTYTEQPELEDNANQYGLLSTRKDSVAIVASQPGQLYLPAIEIPWWNTESDQLEYARLATKQITVENVTTVSPVVPDTIRDMPETITLDHSQSASIEQDTSMTKGWVWLSSVLFVISLISLFAAVHYHHRYRRVLQTLMPPDGQPLAIDKKTTQTSLKMLKNAAQKQDAKAVYAWVSQWLFEHYGHRQISKFIQQLGETNKELSETLLDLQQQTYRQQAPKAIDLMMVYEKISIFYKQEEKERKNSNKVPIDKFYAAN